MFSSPDRRVVTLLLAGVLALFTAATADAAAYATDIYVTDQGLQPSTAFAAVGAQVVWHNDTDTLIRLSDQLFALQPADDIPQLYLPSLAVSGLSRSVLIDAEQGGTIQVANTLLTVPPGALPQDTVITVARPEGLTLGADGIEYVTLEPSGLTFDQPVTLTLTYTDSPDVDEEFINFALYSETTGEWEILPVLARDAAGSQVTVQVSHFSYGAFYTDEPLYLVMELPGQYLRPGDILYRMDPECGQDKADWFPGHTGIYSETVGSAPYDQPIIESNRFDEQRGACDSGGVRPYTMSQFIAESCDFYLGARRPAGVTAAAQVQARDFAARQMDKGYLAIGQGDWLSNGACYSCVGLVEDAYEKAGRDIVPWSLGPGITPLDQYKHTVPVTAITAQVGEQIRIPVYAILKVAASSAPDYYVRGGAVTATGLPPGGTFDDGVFTWTPTVADGGEDFPANFQATGRVGSTDHTESQSLTIHVKSTTTPSPSDIQPITAGSNHTCALTDAGGVLCWGANSSGQLGNGTWTDSSTPVAGTGLGSGVAAVAAGTYHTCALTTSGGVLCWGDNDFGQLGHGTTTSSNTPIAVVGLSSGVVAIAAGGAHTCALTTSGGVLCWGYNGYGQLGDGTTTNRKTPVTVTGLSSNVAAVAAGLDHTCALTTTGGVKCWGWNWAGQLGDGTTTDRSTPVAVSGLSSGAAAVVAGGNHTCALTATGGVKCWGEQYGTRPTGVTGLSSGVLAMAAGGRHICALTVTGGVLCWGWNRWGQLGDGTTVDRNTAVAVMGLGSGVAAVAAGEGHTCARTGAGGVRCWGSNMYGQLGDGTTTRRSTPVTLDDLSSDVAAVTAGYGHNCALTAAGGVLCWGNNWYGQIGDGTATNRNSPLAVTGLSSSVAAISAGGFHNCALTSAGGVLCWGHNSTGQLGDGTWTDSSAPVSVTGLSSGVTAVAAGGNHTCALTDGGGVVCWGWNTSGQLGDGTTTNRRTPVEVVGLSSGVAAISAGDRHTCALTDSGGVVCWGWNASGQLGDGTWTDSSTPVTVTGLSNGVAAITAGGGQTCALTTTGGLMCWGWNISGQLGDGTTTNRNMPVAVTDLSSGVASVSVGGSHTCALTTTGCLMCWGSNMYGQLGDGTFWQRSTPMAVTDLSSGVAGAAAGDGHTCALTSAGGVLCWGSNEYGQVGANPGWTPVTVVWPPEYL